MMHDSKNIKDNENDNDNDNDNDLLLIMINYLVSRPLHFTLALY